MKNVHQREIAAPIERLRPLIEAGWSATADDPFPRDVIRNWRKNPAGVAPLALVPNVTRMGHGPFSFRFESWDGERWRVRVENVLYDGWHGFDLAPTPGGTRLTHTIELQLTRKTQVVWRLCFGNIHDWAVEALFDRVEEAARTGTMPVVTTRPMSKPMSMLLPVLGRVMRRAA